MVTQQETQGERQRMRLLGGQAISRFRKKVVLEASFTEITLTLFRRCVPRNEFENNQSTECSARAQPLVPPPVARRGPSEQARRRCFYRLVTFATVRVGERASSRTHPEFRSPRKTTHDFDPPVSRVCAVNSPTRRRAVAQNPPRIQRAEKRQPTSRRKNGQPVALPPKNSARVSQTGNHRRMQR